MRRFSFCLVALIVGMTSSIADADIVYIDFGTNLSTAATTTDFYNTAPNAGGTNVTFSANLPSITNLTDIDGVTSTGFGANLSFYNNGNGGTRGFNTTTAAGTLVAGSDPAMRTAPAGFEDFATDGYIVNNHSSNGTGVGNEFGFILTYSNLDPALTYNLDLWARQAGGTATSSWSVTTGTGDSDVESYGTSGTDIPSWTNVSPDASGNIVLTNEVIAGGTFRQTNLAFASIEEISAIPEPSSLAILGLSGLALLIRRRK